jgi:hypothetical protein
MNDRAKNRAMNRQAAIRSMRADIIGIYKAAAKHGDSHEVIMEWVNAIRARPAFKELPAYQQALIEGVNDTMWDLHYRDVLVWTHVLDGVRMDGRDPRLEGRYGESHEQAADHSAHCYLIGGVYIPFCEVDRVKEAARLAV